MISQIFSVSRCRETETRTHHVTKNEVCEMYKPVDTIQEKHNPRLRSAAKFLILNDQTHAFV